MPVYLDYNATAPLRPEVREVVGQWLLEPANPSSVHQAGRKARSAIEQARATVAEALSAWPNEIIWMGCGTEANVTALRGFSRRTVLVSAVEHSSVLKQGAVVIPVDTHGIVRMEALSDLLQQHEPALVSVMLANNETGIVQPIAEIAALCKKHGALLHTDAVQGLGKIPLDFGALGVDMMTISAHKMGGPVGAAALVVRRELPIAALFTGGGQELGRRAGTENVAAIAGFARAVELIDFVQMKRLRGWLDEMEAELNAHGAIVLPATSNHQPITKLPNTCNLMMPYVSSEVQLMDFDLQGIAISAGSACSSGKIEVSHALKAMGVSLEEAACAIRMSGGWGTTQAEIQLFSEKWKNRRSRR